VISLFSDASWWRGAGGYAFWARCDGPEKIQGSGEWECYGIDEVETVGLCTGILAALDGLPNTRGVIIAQSDSLFALGLLVGYGGIPAKTSDRPIRPFGCGGMKASARSLIFAQKAMNEVRAQGVKLYAKHVKAHTDNDDPRYRVNAWCDEQAKKARRLCAEKIRVRESKIPVSGISAHPVLHNTPENTSAEPPISVDQGPQIDF